MANFTRLAAILAVAAVAGGFAVARMQSAPPESMPVAPSGAASQAPPASAEPRTAAMPLGNLIGRPVQTPDGRTVGTVSNFIVTQDAHIFAVIDVGGDLAALGTKSRQIVLDWNRMRFVPTGDELVVDHTLQQLQSAPRWQQG
jgi:sporulation protein YlmC with PRC-barrel domain